VNDYEGNVWTAVAHIITGVIGSGVLSLAWSMAQLGWIAGPLAMLFFASITLLSTFLLSDSYRSPDPEYGPARNRSYLEAVYMNLGQIITSSSSSSSFLYFFSVFMSLMLNKLLNKDVC
jgi:amino acid permease